MRAAWLLFCCSGMKQMFAMHIAIVCMFRFWIMIGDSYALSQRYGENDFIKWDTLILKQMVILSSYKTKLLK